MLKGILLSPLLIAGCILAQIVISHCLRPRITFVILIGLFVISLPLYVLLYLATPPTLGFLPDATSQTPFALGLLNGLLVHLLLYGSYIQCFYYLSTPLTLRILEEFLNAERGFLRLSELRERYGLHHILQGRLERLAANGYIQEEKECYRVTKKGRFFAAVFKAVRRFLGVPYYLALDSKT